MVGKWIQKQIVTCVFTGSAFPQRTEEDTGARSVLRFLNLAYYDDFFVGAGTGILSIVVGALRCASLEDGAIEDTRTSIVTTDLGEPLYQFQYR